MAGIRINGTNHLIEVEYEQTTPYGQALIELGRLLNSVDTVVLFNAKFDLNWLGRYGIFLRRDQRVFDCQLCKFLLGNQRPSFPSLDDCLAEYNLGSKRTNINDQYWSKGIDTPQIPLGELKEYLDEDLRLTELLYHAQLDRIPESKRVLLNLQFEDLRVLQEMEFNGQSFDWVALNQAKQLAEEELKGIDAILKESIKEDCRDVFNWDSGDHLSCFLYGGVIRGKRGTPYQREYKSGQKAGQVVTANRWETYEYKFEGLVKPPKGSELKKKGYYSTDEGTLLSLPKSKAPVRLLLRRAELDKLISTYYGGIPSICEKYDWRDGKLHGQFNQCRVITGRLSSEKPNQQNFPEVLNQFQISRFPEKN